MKFYVTSKISENISETPEGYLVCIGVSIARTGEMDYGPGETPLQPGPDGRVVISRNADEVFRPETIASFEGKAITITHPVEFVSPENWAILTKGVLQNVRRGKGEQEGDLVADLLITDSAAINLVKNGLREVSCGYEAEYTETGIGRGVQSNIIGNHLALVDEGRAGSSYAINDHKGKGLTMKLGDKIKAIFVKAQDEAIKVADAAACADPAKDGNMETPETKTGFVSYDDMKKMMDEFGSKMDSFMGSKGKDASTMPTENEPAKVVAKDDEVASPLESRLKKLEDMVAKMMSAQAGDEDMDEEGEETGDEDDLDMSEDDDFDESTMVGDAASRLEILAPGMKMAKGAKGKALLACYATKDGKAVIDQFTGGKIPDVKDVKMVGTLFIAASEVLKANRTSEFAQTKVRDSETASQGSKKPMTAQEVNDFNSKHYANKRPL